MILELSTALPFWQVLVLALVSFLVGVLGGFVGLALGTMRLPALLFIGVSHTTAAGTNILVSTLSAIVGGVPAHSGAPGELAHSGSNGRACGGRVVYGRVCQLIVCS